MKGIQSRNKESEFRLLSAVGIFLSLVAYLLFLGLSSPWNFIVAAPTAVSALGASFYGLWSLNVSLKAHRSAVETRQGGEGQP